MDSRCIDVSWKDSEMREWLNSDVYNSMTDVKDYIKEVDKQTDNIGYSENKTNSVDDVTKTQDKVFLLSVVEVGLQEQAENDLSYPYMNQINGEGATYEWFESNSLIDSSGFWLRSPDSSSSTYFFCSEEGGIYGSPGENGESVFPAFVIGK